VVPVEQRSRLIHLFPTFHLVQREKTSQGFRDATKRKYKSSRLGRLKKETTFPMDNCGSSQQHQPQQDDAVNCTSNYYASLELSNIGNYHNIDIQNKSIVPDEMNTAAMMQRALYSCPAVPVISTTNSEFDFSKAYSSCVRNQEVASLKAGSDSERDSKLPARMDSIGDELVSCAEEYLAFVLNNYNTSNESQCKGVVSMKSIRQWDDSGENVVDDSNFDESNIFANDSKVFDLLLQFSETSD
jgi:hypothetical protein